MIYLEVCFILDFNLHEVDDILQNVRNTNNILIQNTSHFKKQAKTYKYCSYDLTYELLQNHVPHDIKYSEDNKFKVRYLNPNNEKYYTCIVIFIVDNEKIRIITTHPERRKKYD